MSEPQIAKPKNGPTFPAPSGNYDDDLTDEQSLKLSAGGGARYVHIDLAKGASTTGVMVLPTWTCPTHKLVIAQGDPCPKCGKKLLLD